MKPDIWKDCAWGYLYFNVLDYPENPSEKQKQRAKRFFGNLLVPCENCQVEYENYIKDNPVNDYTVSCRNNLVKWLCDFRNNINTRLGKSACSYDDIIDPYIKNIQKAYQSNFYNYLYCIVLIVVIVMVGIIILNKL